MSRLIKFRGLLKQKGQWLYGSLVTWTEQTGITYLAMAKPNANEFNYHFNESVYVDVACQYTGLTDKNGVEIYEGDILKATSETIYLMTGKKTGNIKSSFSVVVWSDENACFENGGIVKYMSQSIISKYSEVAGNIHENPELVTK